MQRFERESCHERQHVLVPLEISVRKRAAGEGLFLHQQLKQIENAGVEHILRVIPHVIDQPGICADVCHGDRAAGLQAGKRGAHGSFALLFFQKVIHRPHKEDMIEHFIRKRGDLPCVARKSGEGKAGFFRLLQRKSCVRGRKVTERHPHALFSESERIAPRPAAKIEQRVARLDVAGKEVHVDVKLKPFLCKTIPFLFNRSVIIGFHVFRMCAHAQPSFAVKLSRLYAGDRRLSMQS